MKLLFTETTTLGVRSYEVERRALERSCHAGGNAVWTDRC